MEDDQFDEPLPPLAGVAPLWRLLAVLSLFGLAVLLCVVIVLVISLAQQSAQSFANAGFAGPAPPMVAAGGAGDAPAEDVLDPDNPPYPLHQDLRPAGTFPLPGNEEAPDERPAPSPRRDFLKDAIKPAVWSSTDPDGTDRVLVSPDGQSMAYAWGRVLMAGAPGSLEIIDDNGPVVPQGGGMAGVRGRRAGWALAQGPAIPAAPRPRGEHPHATLSGWSFDGTKVYWSSAGGLILGYMPQAGRVDRTTARAEFALPLNIRPEQVGQDSLLAILNEQRPKADGAKAEAGDRSALFILPPDGADKHPTVLVPGSRGHWQDPAISPIDRRLAVISDHDQKPGQWRVFLLPLEGGEPKPEPVSPPAARVAGVCWTPDGKALVYARSQSPAPADHAPGTAADACDLWLLDLETRKETRLSRGGGFMSPSVTKNGDLFFLNRTAAGVALEQMPLQTAREFAEEQEEQQRKMLKAWTELADAVWTKAKLADPAKVALTADLIRKVDAAYRDEYGKVMKAAPPDATPAGLDRQRREVAALDLAPATRARLELILGAVESQCPALTPATAAWNPGEGVPLVTRVSAENPFAFACNPFRPLKPGDSPSLAEVLYRAEGRRLVLTNDPAAAQEQLKKLADPDLDRGIDLLKQNKGDEADRVLLEMVKHHAGNHYLVVHVGTLFHEHGRKKALADLLQPLLEQLDARGTVLPRDARLYNLLGIAALDGDPQKAITAFGNALRCDLDCGPAYLNLAQASYLAGRAKDARLGLRRYLALFPKGEWAEDARRRLAVAAGENNGPLLPVPPVAPR